MAAAVSLNRMAVLGALKLLLESHVNSFALPPLWPMIDAATRVPDAWFAVRGPKAVEEALRRDRSWIEPVITCSYNEELLDTIGNSLLAVTTRRLRLVATHVRVSLSPRHFVRFEALRTLTLHCVLTPDAGCFTAAPFLEELELVSCTMNTFQFPSSDTPKWTRLALERCLFHERRECFAGLSRIDTLTDVSVTSSSLNTEEFLEEVASLPELRTLNIDGDRTLLASLSACFFADSVQVKANVVDVTVDDAPPLFFTLASLSFHGVRGVSAFPTLCAFLAASPPGTTTQLEALAFKNCSIATPLDAFFHSWSNVATLELHRTEVTREVVGGISKLPCLTTVVFDGIFREPAPDGEITVIELPATVTSLSLASSNQFSFAIRDWASLKHLHVSVLSYSTPQSDFRAAIRLGTALQRIVFDDVQFHPSTATELTELMSVLPDLQELMLRSCPVSDVSPLSKCPSLKCLTLGQLELTKGLSGLESIATLTSLTVDHCKGVSTVAPFVGLTKLAVSGAPLIDTDVVELATSSTLTDLTLDYAPALCYVGAFARCNSLTRLSLKASAVNSATVAALCRSPSLLHLDLRHCANVVDSRCLMPAKPPLVVSWAPCGGSKMLDSRGKALEEVLEEFPSQR